MAISFDAGQTDAAICALGVRRIGRVDEVAAERRLAALSVLRE